MYTDPQKLPGVIPGDPQKPIPILSSSNYSMESGTKDRNLRGKRREHGLFYWLLAQPLRRALETIFGGRRRGDVGAASGDAVVFGPNGALGEVWNEEMSSSMLGKRLRKVVQNYQVRETQRHLKAFTIWKHSNKRQGLQLVISKAWSLFS